MDWHINDSQQSWSFSYLGGSNEPEEGVNPGSGYPLAEAAIGKRVWLIGSQGKKSMEHLLSMGLTTGMEVKIVSRQPSGSVVVKMNNKQIGIGAGLAQKVWVRDESLTTENNIKTFLGEMPEGTRCTVVGYDKARWGYRGKLVSMGLAPGAEFTVIKVGSMGHPVDILLNGFHLSLRKQEADALVIETVDEEKND